MKLKTRAVLAWAALILLLWPPSACFAESPFIEVPCDIPGVSDGCVAWGDFNNDGYLDLLIGGSGATGPIARIYKNDGRGNFNEFPSTLNLEADSVCTWIDYNADGFLDIAMASNSSDKSVTVYVNDHGRSFNRITVAVADLPNPLFAYGDFDNDGNLDLITGAPRNSKPRQAVWKYHKNKSSTFDTTPESLNIFNALPAAGDWDNDGLLDLAVTGMTRHGSALSLVYRNAGNGILKEIRASLPNLSHAALALGDYDNDGSLDLIITGQSGKRLVTRLFRNSSDFADVPPVAPIELRTSVSEQSVTLSWASATDVNQPNGLTYNLRVGTSPGTADVIACLSDPLGGARRVPRIGNMNQQLVWSAELPQGVYYWSVQAIDHSYAASEFALEQRFEVQSQPIQLSQTQENRPEPSFVTPALTIPPLATNSPSLASNPVPSVTANLPPVLPLPARAPLPTNATSVTTVASRPPAMLGIDSQKRLYLSGAANRNYRIEASSDFAHWQTLGSITAESQPISFVDPDPSTGTMKFYRAVIQPLPPTLYSLHFSNTFNFEFPSEPGQSYEVEASTNLRDWESLMRFTASGTNVLVSDPASVEFPQRFYRIQVAP